MSRADYEAFRKQIEDLRTLVKLQNESFAEQLQALGARLDALERPSSPMTVSTTHSGTLKLKQPNA
jgi:hypothetical protein